MIHPRFTVPFSLCTVNTVQIALWWNPVGISEREHETENQ